MRRMISRPLCVGGVVHALVYVGFLVCTSVQSPAAEPNASGVGASRVYDCAANSLFLLCRMAGKSVSYEQCAELLPMTHQGNSMLEMKRSLVSVGFHVEAVRINVEEISRMQVPAILFACPPSDAITKKEQSGLGHYLVVLPLGDEEYQVLDFPRSPIVLSGDVWAKYLRSIGIENVSILLCGEKEHSAEDMLAPQVTDHSCQASPCTFSRTEDGRPFVVLKEGGALPVLHWDFGDVAEGSVIRKVFTLVNGTDREIRVLKVVKGCTCNELAIDKDRLLPGESLAATIFLSLAGRESAQSISSSIVFDEESLLPPARLIITGNACPRWICEQSKVDFGLIEKVSPVQTRRISIKRTNFGRNSCLSHVTCDSEIIEADISEVADGSYTITLSIDPDKVVGNFHDRINVFAMGQDEPALSCYAMGEVYREITARPCRLLIKASKSDGGIVCLYHRDGREIELVSWEIEGCDKNEGGLCVREEQENGVLQVIVSQSEEQTLVREGTLMLMLRVRGRDIIKTVGIPFFREGK